MKNRKWLILILVAIIPCSIILRAFVGWICDLLQLYAPQVVTLANVLSKSELFMAFVFVLFWYGLLVLAKRLDKRYPTPARIIRVFVIAQASAAVVMMVYTIYLWFV